MTASAGSERPDTVMGRALAARVLAHLAPPAPPGTQPAIDLTASEPVSTPVAAREAAKTALDQGETHYTAGTGIPALREAIAGRMTRDGFPATVETIGVTNGGTEALYVALQSVLSPGQSALIAEPVPQHIVDMVSFIGATPHRLETDADARFVPDPGTIAGSEARVLLLASPSPVSGTMTPNDDLERIIAAARERGMTVILNRSDAPGAYEPWPPFGNPELAWEIVTAGSFSTAYGLEGWRIGYFSAPAADTGAFGELKQAMSICTTAVSQFAALAALQDTGGWLEQRRQTHAARLAMVREKLDAAGLRIVQPDAFPYLLIDVSHLGDDWAVAERLADEYGVAVQPGSSFGRSAAGHIRINLGAPESTLTDGIERLIALHERSREAG